MKYHKTRHKKIYWLLFTVLVLVGVWNVWKPLPEEINKAYNWHNISGGSIAFLADTTYIDSSKIRVSDQHIFDEVFSMIQNAQSYIFIDMFLWNDFGARSGNVHRPLSSQLTQALIAKKKENPTMVIQVVSDPINSVYDGQGSQVFSQMKDAGIQVTMTNLPALRDSNPVVSSLWRVFVYPLDTLHKKVFGKPYTVRLFPNLVDAGGEKVTLRSHLTLLNFKANHRKLVVADEMVDGIPTLTSLVTSANPHDGSSAHSNVALKVRGPLALDLLTSEARIIAIAGGVFASPTVLPPIQKDGEIHARVVTDRAILDAAVQMIQSTEKGDTIDLLMFYLAERNIIKELVDASLRGVAVRIILDPNKDAFGREKNGIPNREVADTLVKKSTGTISVRWCDTHGEQCHGKTLVVHTKDGYHMMLGSANFTRRNIGGYNLETNVAVRSKDTYQSWNDASSYFDSLWNNTQGNFSTEYEVYKDESTIKKITAWIMENIGLGTF